MASVLLSEAEKTFICHGVEDNLRADGQGRGDMRPLVLETGVVSHASVSCHLRLANTDILVGVKTELETPDPAAKDRGRVEFFVNCSARSRYSCCSGVTLKLYPVLGISASPAWAAVWFLEEEEEMFLTPVPLDRRYSCLNKEERPILLASCVEINCTQLKSPSDKVSL